MTRARPHYGPIIIPETVTTWRASDPAVEVVAGGWVTFNSEGRPAWLWFPIPGQVEQDTPVDLQKGPVSIRTDPTLPSGTKIPYVFFLTHVGDAGDFLMGNSPPYIKIKDPRDPRGGVGGDDGD